MSETNGHITKQDFLDMESRLHTGIESAERRLRAGIDTLETRVESLETRVQAGMESLESRIHADVENVETKLLTEFWKWGRVADQKMRRMDFSDATTVERITTLDERVFTLERKALGSKE